MAGGKNAGTKQTSKRKQPTQNIAKPKDGGKENNNNTKSTKLDSNGQPAGSKAVTGRKRNFPVESSTKTAETLSQPKEAAAKVAGTTIVTTTQQNSKTGLYDCTLTFHLQNLLSVHYLTDCLSGLVLSHTLITMQHAILISSE